MKLRTLTCVGLAIAALATATPAQDPSSLVESLLGRDPASLTNIDVTTKEFPALGLKATFVKAIDPVTGETLAEGRLSNGERADLSQLMRNEIAAQRANPEARIMPHLRKAMNEATATQRIPVGIWLVHDSSAIHAMQAQLFDGQELTADEAAHREAMVTQEAMALVARTNAPFAQLLEQIQLGARYVSTSAPVVFTDATVDEIRTLAAFPEVEALYFEHSDYADTNNDANSTHRTDRVHHYGVRGRGIDVALLEDNGVDPACPHLNITDWFNAGNPDPDDHIHGTSGCVGSQLPSRLGSAPDVRLYSANATTYSDSNVMAAADWIVAEVVIDITNMSYGGQRNGVQSLMDRYYDYQVRTYQDSYIASAGNSGIGADVGSPAQATNVVAVGSFDEQENSDWDDDVMSTFSSTGDPNSGCAKPNLAANGENVDTIGMAPDWLRDAYDGTSFSSPHCAGNLANAMSKDVTLNTSPEAAMAALMATAWHNIEGSSRNSAEDGAGGLHGLALYRTGVANRAASTTLSASSFSTNGYYTYNITLKGQERTRVAIAWSNAATSNFNSSVLDADLDLAVYQGTNQTSGTSMGFSSSFNNNYELIEFTPPTSGTYTIRINDYRFDGTTERVGMAWTQKWRDTSYARIREDGNDEGSSFTGPTVGSQSYDLDLLSASPSATYLIAPSASDNFGFSLSAEDWSPLDYDIWTQIFATGEPSWQGFIGTTNTAGTATAPQLRIANFPQLYGARLLHVGITADNSRVGGIKEISEVFPFWFWPARQTFTLSDDGTQEHNLPFNFTFFGQSYSSVWVNSNGNLTFGSGDTDFSESQLEFLRDQPRIAAIWDDFNPASSNGIAVLGTRSISQNDRHFVVEYSDVGEYEPGGTSTGYNTFRVVLWADGRIQIEFNDMTVNDGLVGISPGGDLSSNDPVVLSSWGQTTRSGAFYELFDATNNPFNLDGVRYWNRITFTPAGSSYQMTMDVQ